MEQQPKTFQWAARELVSMHFSMHACVCVCVLSEQLASLISSAEEHLWFPRVTKDIMMLCSRAPFSQPSMETTEVGF